MEWELMAMGTIFDEAAAGWAATFDSTASTENTVIRATLPGGWADGELYLVCVPFDAPHWVRPFAALETEVKTSELGSRGYLYIANLKDGVQKNAPILTYRFLEGGAVAFGR